MTKFALWVIETRLLGSRKWEIHNVKFDEKEANNSVLWMWTYEENKRYELRYRKYVPVKK